MRHQFTLWLRELSGAFLWSITVGYGPPDALISVIGRGKTVCIYISPQYLKKCEERLKQAKKDKKTHLTDPILKRFIPLKTENDFKKSLKSKREVFLSSQSERGAPPPIELLHLLNGVGSGQALWGRGAGGTLPRRGPVHVVHKEDPPVAVDPSLPV